MVVFFLVPFALRGARMAVQGMKNDVKDWLPKEFEETKDLDEFRQLFPQRAVRAGELGRLLRRRSTTSGSSCSWPS